MTDDFAPLPMNPAERAAMDALQAAMEGHPNVTVELPLGLTYTILDLILHAEDGVPWTGLPHCDERTDLAELRTALHQAQKRHRTDSGIADAYHRLNAARDLPDAE